MTPLLDVVLQLITFFMMLVHFATHIEGATRAVALPTAAAALPGADLTFDRLAVAIDARGRLLVGATARDEAAAAAWWAEQARARWEGLGLLGARETGPELPTLVVVRADRAVPYGVVRRTLQTAQKYGFARFTLVVLRNPSR